MLARVAGHSSSLKSSSTGVPNNLASLIASFKDGSYLSFSIAMMVWRVTPTIFAISSCRNPIFFRNALMLLFTVSVFFSAVAHGFMCHNQFGAEKDSVLYDKNHERD